MPYYLRHSKASKHAACISKAILENESCLFYFKETLKGSGDGGEKTGSLFRYRVRKKKRSAEAERRAGDAIAGGANLISILI